MQAFKDFIDFLCGPVVFFSLSIVFFALGIHYRYLLTRSRVALGMLVASVLFVAFAITDPNFRAIGLKPDNVPILGMAFLVGFFTWLGMRQAVDNDRRIAAGGKPREAEGEEQVHTWPDLVYIELIALVGVTALLLVWSIFLKAPLEEPADPTTSPNPAKAPWYFLGLQEMLVYFDPWLAGVVFPGLIITGLILIPYIDRSPKGSGYYSFKGREAAVSFYLFGFLVLWVLLIVVGTFLRGPNWNFFGPFDFWDVHKLPVLVNVNLSEIIYMKVLGVRLPSFWLIREFWGILAVGLYLFALPPLLARTWFKGLYARLGTPRYALLMFHFLVMFSLPIKMYLRWAFNLKYVVSLPEFFFNI
jgi:hypothetical protein